MIALCVLQYLIMQLIVTVNVCMSRRRASLRSYMTYIFSFIKAICRTTIFYTHDQLIYTPYIHQFFAHSLAAALSWWSRRDVQMSIFRDIRYTWCKSKMKEKKERERKRENFQIDIKVRISKIWKTDQDPNCGTFLRLQNQNHWFKYEKLKNFRIDIAELF